MATNTTTGTAASDQPTDELIGVSDVSGADPSLREDITRSSAACESAIASLRDAVRELQRSDDEAWRRYAVDLEDATRRFDTSIGVASARLRAERAASKDELTDVLNGVLDRWRSVADELRVRAHVGQMDVSDFASETVEELDRASHQLTAVLSRLRGDAGDTLASLRSEAAKALDEAASIFRGLRPGT